MNPVYRKRLPIPQIGWQVAVAMSGLISFGVIQIGQANDFTLVRSVVSSAAAIQARSEVSLRSLQLLDKPVRAR